MTNFFGTPFIDIRVDFNSWIPRLLDDELAKKLLNYYLNKFKKIQIFMTNWNLNFYLLAIHYQQKNFNN